MASLIDIRRRLRSLKNTQQITRAMKMVAAARLRRAQDRAIAARPYAKLLRDVLASVSARVTEAKHPLLAAREEKRVILLIVAGDRGLAGAFNANVHRSVHTLGERATELYESARGRAAAGPEEGLGVGDGPAHRQEGG